MRAGELVKCRACPAMMRAAGMPSGSVNPLDLAEIPLEYVLSGEVKGVVAYSPRSAHGLSVTKARLADEREKVEGWPAQGVTFHLSHFATCPERKRFK